MISPLNCKPPITAKQTKDQHQTVLIQRCQQVYALDLDNALSHNVKESEKKIPRSVRYQEYHQKPVLG